MALMLDDRMGNKETAGALNHKDTAKGKKCP